MSQFYETFALIPVEDVAANPAQRQLTLRSVPLTYGKQVLIGRDKSCDLRIDLLDISRRHAILNSEDNNWFITDLESTNGLYLNDRPLIAFTPYCLTIGDKISFGPSLDSRVMYRFVVKRRHRLEPTVRTPKKRPNESMDSQLVSKRVCNEWQQLLDSELSCSVCHELFVTAVTLNCSHTFCHSCIEDWKHSSDGKHRDSDDEEQEDERPAVVRSETQCCPICRQTIVSQNRVLVLDNTIEYILQKFDPKLLEHRKQLIAMRRQLN